MSRKQHSGGQMDSGYSNYISGFEGSGHICKKKVCRIKFVFQQTEECLTDSSNLSPASGSADNLSIT